MLEVSNLTHSYGAVRVLHGVDLSVGKGEVVALIGANGAGKTTTLRCISGLLQAIAGEVRLGDSIISSLPPHRIARSGVGHVLEGRHLFPHLTVRQNLDMGAWRRSADGALEADLDRIFSLFPRLKERLDQKAGTLSGGEQQMVAMARSLVAKPDILLLDEPSMGLAPRVVDTIFEIIAEVARSGLSILLVEQNASRALALADRAYVMELGRIVMSGDGRELAANEDVRRSYLGE